MVACLVIASVVFWSTFGDLWLVSRMVTYAVMVPRPPISLRDQSPIRKLLLDEPDSNLDPEGRDAARALIGRREELNWQAEDPVTRVAVSHDPDRARTEADQVLELAIAGVMA